MMGLGVLLALLAFILAVIAGVLGRASTTSIMLAIAIALLAAIHLIGGFPIR